MDPYAPAYKFRDFYIPNYMMGAIDRYVNLGIPPGDFLTAVITNDLSEAVARADDTNIHNLPAYVGYFFNNVPGIAWGSRERMEHWMGIKARELAANAATEH